MSEQIHDLPEDFKMTELGPLPREWQVVRLGKVATILMGQSPPSETYNSRGIGLPFLQGKAEFGDVCPTPTKWCSQPLRISPKGAILLSVRAPVGDVNLAQSEYCIGRGLAAICAGEKADTGFLTGALATGKHGKCVAHFTAICKKLASVTFQMQQSAS